ncbi:BTAD domain-containing putative transcriptional regulator [Streptomyces sp. NPDC101118]|uniref:AfsR/SARP family transcriptional regulator n=1 Tax=Streptomyces sp. NPDC101118 TaxID=3366109 RepID=UPI0037FB857B
MTVEDGAGRETVVQGAKQRALLAVLLGRQGAAASGEVLAGALWGADPPESAAAMLRWHVHKLRKSLGDDRRLTRSAGGHTLVLAPGELDAAEFEGRYAAARRLYDGGDPAGCAEQLEAGERLWRGPAYEDLDLDALREEAARLEELRAAAQELAAEADLALGRTAPAVSRLRLLVAAHPLRELPRARLMHALYLAGRQAEALALYQEGRRLLADELGIDPGPELRTAERLILTQAPELRPPLARPPLPHLPQHPQQGPQRPSRTTAPPPPTELPRGTQHFTGRAAEAALLAEALADGGIAAVSGPPGIGKTALAVHVAHRLAPRYPDGQCWVPLRTAPGTGPLLRRLLRSLGTPAGDPGLDELTPDELTAAFRTATAGRRVLLLLDGAEDAPLIAPLLPAGPAAGVLITGRAQPAAPAVDLRVRLGPLSPAESVALLAASVADGRLGADPGSAAALAAHCDGLPLALSIVAARMLARPRWSAAEFAVRLADERRRLDELDDGERSVRCCLQGAYEGVARGLRGAVRGRLLPLFALVGAVGAVSVRTAARALGMTERDTEWLLEALTDVQLLETDAPGWYRAEGLTRLFAREGATTAKRPAAVREGTTAGRGAAPGQQGLK